MLETLSRAFQVPELRKRLLFVLMMFAVFMVAVHIPVPGIDRHQLDIMFKNKGFLDLINQFSGGALRRYSVLAMSITPYINATIIMQLMGVLVPQIEELRKEGESGRRQIAKWTRWLTVVLAIAQASMMNVLLTKQHILNVGPVKFVGITLILVAGTSFLMWMGEMITERGIGNGVSLVIFVGIMVRLPQQFVESWQLAKTSSNFFLFGLLLVLFLLIIVSIVTMNDAERRIKIQSARKVQGTKIYQGSTTYLPIKMTSAGVMPIIFAISVLLVPATLVKMIPPNSHALAFLHISDIELVRLSSGIMRYTSPGQSAVASVLYFLLVVFFTFFYTAVTYNVTDIADNLRKSGSYIPAVRMGRPTHDHIDRILTRLTAAGAIYFGFIALTQYYIPTWTGFPAFTLVGGTSLLIVVGVGLETMMLLETQLLMRDYEGFIK